MPQVNDHETHARRLRDRAQECRALAEIADDERAKAAYVQLADAYERLAGQEDHLTQPRGRIEDVLGRCLD